MTKKVSIIGGSGYTGGELIRLLLSHPHVEIGQVTSQRYLGKFVHNAHPNLRGQKLIKFTSPDQMEPCDILFLALPHKTAARDIERYAQMAEHIIDLSADFRLRDAAVYKKWYGEDHAAPSWLDRFVYGLPELHRTELATAKYVSGVGCNATAVNLALYPLAAHNMIDHVVAEVKVGSSEGGNSHSLASHHPERSGAVRSFAPTTHRHQAEMQQELGISQIYFSATAIEMVRGVMCTAHCFLKDDIEEKEVWKLYRKEYKGEPFIRLVKDNTGIYRFPEPKILQGTNYCDIGFAKEEGSKRLVVMSAIDNLMKGAAGSAVQSMNVMMGWDEKTALDFPGLHPIQEGNKLIVVKVGGSEGIDLDALCADFASLVAEGKKIILVHGGSHQTNVVAEKLGYPPKFITSPSGYTSRLTDRKTLEIFEMVYCGEINKGIVERLQKHGVNAVGLSGIDGRLWEGPRKKAVRAVENGKVRVVRNNLTGIVEKVNTTLLENLLNSGFMPVLCPPAISYEGEAINVDGDRAAGQTAIALQAEVLLLLSNVPGLLKEFPDESSLISTVKFSEIPTVEKYAEGRMRMKVLGAKEALQGGVGKVIMGDARVENSIRKALEGNGTTFSKQI